MLRWLDHMQNRISETVYTKGYWRVAKMRYVYHVTGPRCMQNFLQAPANADVLKDCTYLSCNHFKDAEKLQRYSGAGWM